MGTDADGSGCRGGKALRKVLPQFGARIGGGFKVTLQPLCGLYQRAFREFRAGGLFGLGFVCVGGGFGGRTRRPGCLNLVDARWSLPVGGQQRLADRALVTRVQGPATTAAACERCAAWRCSRATVSARPRLSTSESASAAVASPRTAAVRTGSIRPVSTADCRTRHRLAALHRLLASLLCGLPFPVQFLCPRLPG